MEENTEYYLLMGNLLVKRLADTDEFYLLNRNGEWIEYPSLVSMFYDPGVDQQTVPVEEIAAEIAKLNGAEK